MNLWGYRFSQNANQNFSRFLHYQTNKDRSTSLFLWFFVKCRQFFWLPSLFVWYGRNLEKFWLAFWEKRWPHTFILNLTDLYWHHPLYFFYLPPVQILERWTLNMSCCFFPSFFVNKKKETLKSNLRLRHLLHKKKLVWRSKHI